jgi:hypothetical protein
MRNPHMDIIRWQYLRMSTAVILGLDGMGGQSNAGEPVCIPLVIAALSANTFGLPHFWWLPCCSWRFTAPY